MSKKAWILVDYTQKPVVPVDQMTTEVIVPTVNLNGSSSERLIEQDREVMSALRDVQKAMANASPHGRDYQTRPASVYDAAAKQFRRQYSVIDQLSTEFQEMALAVQAQERK